LVKPKTGINKAGLKRGQRWLWGRWRQKQVCICNSHTQHRERMIQNYIEHDDTGGCKVLTPKKPSW